MTSRRSPRAPAAPTRSVSALLWFGLLGGWGGAFALVLIGWWAVEVGCPGTDRPLLLLTTGASVVVTIASLAAAVVASRRLKGASGAGAARGAVLDDRSSVGGGPDRTGGGRGGGGAAGGRGGGPARRGGVTSTIGAALVAMVAAVTAAPRPRGSQGLAAWELVGGGDRRRFLAVTAVYFDLLALGIVLFSLPPVLLHQPCA